jgi:hypothetical protein
MIHLNITKYTDPEDDWWVLNPQTKYIPPFSELFKRGGLSSRDMWTIFFLCDPDEKINKFYTTSFDKRLEVLTSTYHPEFNVDDELIQRCMKAYPEECLTALGRMYKMEKDSMIDRGHLLATTPYVFDTVETDPKGATIYVQGRPMIRKGNAKDLDAMRGNTTKIMAAYIQLEKQFEEEKSNLRIHGGRRENIREKDGLIEDIDRSKLNPE